MKKKILLFFLILLAIESCQQNSTKPFKVKSYDCCKEITALNIDSLPLYKSFSDHGEFLDINDEFKTKINGKIQETRECYYKKCHRFDEDILTPTVEIINQFNDKNHLIKSTSKLILDGTEYVSAENSYSAGNKLLSKGSFEKDYKTINLYYYSIKGQLQSIKTKWDFKSTNLSDRIMSNINWGSKKSYHYNSKGQIIKEVESYFGGDSCVVKYDYESTGGLQIIKYDKKSGVRSFTTNLYYDKDNNTLTAKSWNVLLDFTNDQTNDKNLGSQIIVFYDSNCNVNKVTKVEKWINNTKKYSKLEFNKQGDVISKSYIVYPNRSENDFNFDYKEEFEPEFILEPEYENYEYVYDRYGNWIERTNGENVVKRKIKYRTNS